MITLRGERRKMKEWLKLSGSSVFPALFEHYGETYLWKCSIVGQLSFYKASSPGVPIAWFETSKRRVIEGVPNISRPYLALQPDALLIQDITIVSFLVLEQKSRMMTKSGQIISGSAGFGLGTLSDF
ncbi:hypothetical protein BD779DRAFT_1677796 [Infundibulicybe gibba]|nr:hypothetical protein BD779DRAFT_1677796 [Infundibulicybe gibba]